MTNSTPAPIVIDLTASLDQGLSALPLNADGVFTPVPDQEIHIIYRNMGFAPPHFPQELFVGVTSSIENGINTRDIYKTLNVDGSNEIAFEGYNWDESGDNCVEVDRTIKVQVCKATARTAEIISLTEADTVRKYEKVGLSVLLAGTASMLMSIALMFVDIQFAARMDLVVWGLLFPLFLMPILAIGSLVNIPIMIYQHARFLARRGAITLGIFFGSLIDLAAVVVAFCLLIIASVHL